jgi:hypothetical protein
MRIVRPSSVDNVDDDRIIDSFRQINERIASADFGRGQCVRDAARRTIIIDSMQRRGMNVQHVTPNANVAACFAVFGITPKGTPA